jgi:hypothetical protein
LPIRRRHAGPGSVVVAFDSKFVLTPPPFAVAPVQLDWFYDLKLQARLRQQMDQSGMQKLGIAMVDLTRGGGRAISYAGYNDERQTFAGSLPKIVIMLAAFRLREQVREAAQALGIVEPKKLFAELAKAWGPLISREASGRTASFPRLDQIFHTDMDPRKIDFSPEFLFQMDRTIEGVGSNAGAAFCTRLMGFAYINGVLQWEGFQFGRMGHTGFKGLSLSLDYGGHSWASDGGATAQGATAKAVAAFLTALQARRLVSKDASDEMIARMMNAVSWFKSGLVSANRRPGTMFKKIGVAGTYSEGAVIERQEAVFFRYAAAVLGAPTPELLWQAIVNIDSLMEARSP